MVGIGASAGGLAASEAFFRAMSPDSGVAFVLIQHLDPTHESLTPELLRKCTTMPVVQVDQETHVEPNRVYVIAPNRYLSIEDGALGLTEIKATGGMTMAQDPETVQYDGMPRSAIETGGVDHVLPVEQMPETIVKYVRHNYVKAAASSGRLHDPRDEVTAILPLLKARGKVDFGCYRKPRHLANARPASSRRIVSPATDACATGDFLVYDLLTERSLHQRRTVCNEG